jgi:tetratricopeptide (TPR) repeat protein
MAPPDPSFDPYRTVDHDAKASLETVDANQAVSTNATGPYIPAPPADAPSIPGYRITEEIARGGMGRVYAGHDLTLDREVAIKTLRPGADAERFVTEAKITAKLPHPNIPPVYALGTLPNGTPWLAMKLIHGQTLAALLKPRSSPSQDLPRYIQIFEQIAQAVGFAHSRGIIHRDLKLLNVMVGEFGEVQVMDWGLAKELASSERKFGESSPDDDNLHHTAAGTVLGTPGYMAPEQARGEIVDQRADVFALGSILAAILTGQPAFVGTTVHETITKAANADLADVLARLETCGADAELLAVSRRCLAANPEERFADGREVASAIAAYRAGVEARLRRAEAERAEALVREAEQRKRRRLTLVAGGLIAAVLLIGLAVSLWQMRRAIAAEGLAKQNEQQANANEAKALAERDAKDAALRAERQARDQALAALRVLTDELVEKQLARAAVLTEENKEFLRKVIEQFEGFAKITGDDAESRAIRAEGYARVGVMRYRLGDLEEAEESLRASLELRDQLVADFPTRPDYRQELATSHNNLGNLLASTGRPREAEEAYRAALKLYEQLVADFPTRPKFRQELANSCNNLGVLLAGTGQLKEAEEAYRQALKLREQLAAEFPTRPDYRENLATSHNNLGNLLAGTGRPKEAEASFRAGLKLFEQLAADFPTRPDCRQALAGSHNNLGLLLRATGRPKEAEEAFRASLELRDRLVGEFPSRPEYRQELAASHNNLGILLAVTGRLREAEESFRAAVKLQDRLAAEFPNQPDLRNDLAATLGNLANLCNLRRNFATAKECLEKARPHHLAALKANPRHPTYRQFYRNNLLALVQAHAGLLDPAAAVQTAQTARDLGWNPPADAYDAACALALCIPIVEKHEQLDADKRKAAVQFYGDAAMKLLREAVAKGFKDAAHMKQDSDLAPLRQRPDFQKLLKELESQH